MKVFPKSRDSMRFLFTIIVFLLSTVTALYAAVWLKPDVVLVVTILHLVAVGVVIWSVVRAKLRIDWRELARRNWFLLPFVAYAFVSIFWSIHWEISLFRWVILVCTIVLGWYLGQCYTRGEFIKVLLFFALLMLVLSVLVTLVDFQQYGELPRQWRGIFWQKNHTGLFLCLTSLICLLTYIETFHARNGWFYFACMLYVFSVSGMIFTDSASAMMSTLILHGLVLLVLFWLRFRRLLTKTHYRVALTLFVVVVVGVFLNLDRLFGLFGRNISLTGRVPMWEQFFLLYFAKRPWFGYGFNAFWYQPSHRLVLGTVSGLPPIYIADNGFFDLLINTGIVGFALFLLFYGGLWMRSIQVAVQNPVASRFTFVLVMIFVLLGNLTWSMLFENESMYMLILLAFLFLYEKQSPAAVESSN